MHWGQGILLGAARGVMAEKGFRGPVGSFLFAGPVAFFYVVSVLR